MKTTAPAISIVADIPESYILVTDSQTMESIARAYPVIDPESYGCLFVDVLDGEYTAIYGCESPIPYLWCSVDKLI